MSFDSGSQFVIVGAQYNDKFMLWASRELTQISFERVTDPLYGYGYGNPLRQIPTDRNKIIAEVRGYAQITGSDMPDALSILFKDWEIPFAGVRNPQPPPQPVSTWPARELDFGL